jgi:3',5'-cyclic AMP phosphodiesterase CpdA
MKFAVINDMHIGPPESGYFKGVQRKLVDEAERLIASFVTEMNTVEKPVFVVNLGDSIEDVNDRKVDLVQFKKAINALAKLQMPHYFLIGNHDVKTLTNEEIAEMFGYDKMHFSFDSEGYHFIALSFEVTGNHRENPADIGAEVPAEQLEWLRNDLKNTKLPVVVFIHYGLAEDDMKGNFWFENLPDKAKISNRDIVRKILEDSGKVRAVISAHQHWNRMFVHNDIPYFTVTSLVENFNNDGVPAEAYTIVNLEDKKIIIDVKGNDPAKFEYSFST